MAKASTKLTLRGTLSPSMLLTTGSDTAPVTIPSAVIPTWTVEMTRTGSSRSRLAASAPRPRYFASVERRTVTIAYSAMTKNALAPISASTSRTRSASVMPRRARARTPPRMLVARRRQGGDGPFAPPAA